MSTSEPPHSGVHRLYIGGCPIDLTLEQLTNELKRRFASFGTVLTVDLIGQEQQFKGFAYISLETSRLDDVLKVFRGTKWRGSVFKVESARPTYLKRLEQEWDEAANPHLYDQYDEYADEETQPIDWSQHAYRFRVKTGVRIKATPNEPIKTFPDSTTQTIPIMSESDLEYLTDEQIAEKLEAEEKEKSELTFAKLTEWKEVVEKKWLSQAKAARELHETKKAEKREKAKAARTVTALESKMRMPVIQDHSIDQSDDVVNFDSDDNGEDESEEHNDDDDTFDQLDSPIKQSIKPSLKPKASAVPETEEDDWAQLEDDESDSSVSPAPLKSAPAPIIKPAVQISKPKTTVVTPSEEDDWAMLEEDDDGIDPLSVIPKHDQPITTTQSTASSTKPSITTVTTTKTTTTKTITQSTETRINQSTTTTVSQSIKSGLFDSDSEEEGPTKSSEFQEAVSFDDDAGDVSSEDEITAPLVAPTSKPKQQSSLLSKLADHAKSGTKVVPPSQPSSIPAQPTTKKSFGDWFDSDDDDDETSSRRAPVTSLKPASLNDEFGIRPAFEGEHGQHLLMLKRRANFANDPRFQFDERFDVAAQQQQVESAMEVEETVASGDVAATQVVDESAPLSTADELKRTLHSETVRALAVLDEVVPGSSKFHITVPRFSADPLAAKLVQGQGQITNFAKHAAVIEQELTEEKVRKNVSMWRDVVRFDPTKPEHLAIQHAAAKEKKVIKPSKKEVERLPEPAPEPDYQNDDDDDDEDRQKVDIESYSDVEEQIINEYLKVQGPQKSSTGSSKTTNITGEIDYLAMSMQGENNIDASGVRGWQVTIPRLRDLVTDPSTAVSFSFAMEPDSEAPEMQLSLTTAPALPSNGPQVADVTQLPGASMMARRANRFVSVNDAPTITMKSSDAKDKSKAKLSDLLAQSSNVPVTSSVGSKRVRSLAYNDSSDDEGASFVGSKTPAALEALAKQREALAEDSKKKRKGAQRSERRANQQHIERSARRRRKRDEM